MTRLGLIGALMLMGCGDSTAEDPPPVVIIPMDAALDLSTPDLSPPDAEPDAAPLPVDAEPDGPPRRAVPEPTPAPPTVLPFAPRIVAIGDVHGDLTAARAALTTAGVIDANGRWIGDDTVVVQVGDQLDRGDDERAILDWFERLRIEAAEAGGAFYPLIGNHEAINVEFDYRYVTDGGWNDFADVPGDAPPEAGEIEPSWRGRVAAFAPGGPYARVLAGHNAILVVGETVFVHGGILPAHIEYGLERMNDELHAWMRGEGPAPEPVIDGEGPLWVRAYSDLPGDAECTLLGEALRAIPAKRMVVAHTVQDNIISACDEKVWVVDVGLAAYYGGPTEVLEIRDLDVRILSQ